MTNYPALHAPDRPSWTCTACPPGTEWPCDTRKAQLRELAGDNISRIQEYMIPYAAIAQDELGLTSEQTLERFMRWPGSEHRNEIPMNPADLRRKADNAAGTLYWDQRDTM